MIEYGIRLMKIASLKALTGWYSAPDIFKLVDYMVRDYHQTGKVSSGIALRPTLSSSNSRVLEERLLDRTLDYAFSNTKFYRNLGDSLQIEKPTHRNLRQIPTTTKNDLRGHEDQFVDLTSGGPILSFSSTGTTAFPPTRVWMGRREMEQLAAFNAFNLFTSGQILPEDTMLSAVTSRATLSNWVMIESCRVIGASIIHTGTIDPDECLQYLTTPLQLEEKRKKPSVLVTYPSYLELLLERAKKAGYSSTDFALKRLMIVGEVFTEGTARRAKEFFGCEISEFYNISECIQLSGWVCHAGNLHFNRDGLIEVLHPSEGAEVSEGERGVLTVTPYKPPRDVTLLVRYATGDVVRKMNDCECGLQNTFVFSRPLGKYTSNLDDQGLTYREIFEILDSVDDVCRPLRVGVEKAPGNRIRIHFAAYGGKDSGRQLGLGTPAGIELISHAPDEQFEHYPMRSELIEPTFSALRREAFLRVT